MKSVKSYRKKQPIPFPKILSEKCNNEEVFEKIIKSKIEDAFDGVSFTILTYGISGSGKTHTIFGCEEFKKSLGQTGQNGIIFHSIDEIFKLKNKIEENEYFSFECEDKGKEGENGDKGKNNLVKKKGRRKLIFTQVS